MTFAHKIPPMDPTLEQLGWRAVIAKCVAERSDSGSLARQAAGDAREAFWAALEAQTGVSVDVVRELV